MFGIRLVLRRARRAGEMEYVADLQVRSGVDDVALDQREALILQEVGAILAPARQEAVETDDAEAIGDQPIAKVGADEAGAARNQRNAFGCWDRVHWAAMLAARS